jgi:competence protein ComEC
MRCLLIFILILTPLHSLAPGLKPLLVVWNIGQGQWITVITDSACHHFDMGGEHERPPVLHWCLRRTNDLFISHGDLDHIKFVGWSAGRLPRFCIVAPPLDEISDRKKQMLATVPLCPRQHVEDIEIRELTDLQREKNRSGHNEMSRVFLVRTPDGSVLIPGDSTIEAEKVWRKNLRAQDHVHILVLGHHGSRTSTGDDLLNSLPELKLGIASARRARYGHPHAEVVVRLLLRGVSVLSTEGTGHTGFRM